MTYLRNAWYVAAWGHELPRDAAFARTLLDERIVFWRGEDGLPRAVRDRCPHRFAPLSMGKVRGNTITCAYHGLCFDGSGKCVANPHGPIPQRLAVQAYPVVETHSAVWIWMGAPAKADPARIPDLAFLGEAPPTASSKGYLHNDGNYELYVDNILDLSHTDFLHPDTLGSAGLTGTRAEVSETPEYIEVVWPIRGGVALPLLRRLVPTLPEKVDSWTRVRWFAPGVMKLTVGTVAAGGEEEDALLNVNAHILTPETATSCHYFFAATRNFAADDAGLNTQMADARHRIFETEDKPMIEAVQRNMRDAAGAAADFWSLHPMMLPIDAAPVRVRRRLEQLIRDEQAALVAA